MSTYLVTPTSTTGNVNDARWFRIRSEADRFAAESPYRTRVVRIAPPGSGFSGHAVEVARNLTADIMRDATPPTPLS